MIDITANAGVHWEGETKPFKLGEINSIPVIRFTMGPVPVAIKPWVSFYCGAKGSIDAGNVVRITQAGEFVTTLSWLQSGVTTSTKSKFDFKTEEPKWQAKASLDAYVGVSLEAMFYGLGGPFIKIEPYLFADIDTGRLVRWKIKAGVRPAIGLKVADWISLGEAIPLFSEELQEGLNKFQVTAWKIVLGKTSISRPFLTKEWLLANEVRVKSVKPTVAKLGSPVTVTGGGFGDKREEVWNDPNASYIECNVYNGVGWMLGTVYLKDEGDFQYWSDDVIVFVAPLIPTGLSSIASWSNLISPACAENRLIVHHIFKPFNVIEIDSREIEEATFYIVDQESK